MAVIDVTTATFAAEVLDRSRRQPVVVDFWAPWCGPCRALGPVLERLAGEAGGAWVLAKVDTDQNQEIARRYGIQGIPAVKAFRDGQVVAEFVGAQPEPRVRAWLEGLVPKESTLLARKAAAALEHGDRDSAARLFEAALAKDPDEPDARLWAARVAIERGDKNAARAQIAGLRPRDRDARAGEVGRLELALEAPPLDPSAAASPDPAARYGQGLALAAAGRYEEALELFLGLVRADRAWGDDAGRRAMLRVFDVVGTRSPLADEWRKRLSMELYK
ncbi:MAG: thioredoxin [Myxococcota bacterium]